MLPLVLLIASLRAYTSSKTTYTNPVVDVNSPDPGVLGTADGYVAVTSSGYKIENNVFPIRSSRNLVDWTVQGAVFPNKTAPTWAAPPFYAPEIHAIVDGSNGGGTTTYFCVYDATEVATGVMAIGIAWAASPTGPFIDSGQPLMRGIGSANASAIDATLWQPTTREQGTSNVGSTSVSTSGYSSTQMFLAFKNKDNGVRKIMLQELEWTHKRQHGSTGDDGGDGTTSVKAVGDPGTILTSTEAWEGHDVEGPFLWQEVRVPAAAKYTYMFYSGSSTWGTTYAVGVARAETVHGPWEKRGAPIAHSRAGNNSSNTTFVSPGHNSVAHVAAQNATYLVYHANKWGHVGTDCVRYMMVDRLVWGEDGWPSLATADGAPSDVPEPTPTDLQ